MAMGRRPVDTDGPQQQQAAGRVKLEGGAGGGGGAAGPGAPSSSSGAPALGTFSKGADLVILAQAKAVLAVMDAATRAVLDVVRVRFQGGGREGASEGCVCAEGRAGLRCHPSHGMRRGGAGAGAGALPVGLACVFGGGSVMPTWRAGAGRGRGMEEGRRPKGLGRGKRRRRRRETGKVGAGRAGGQPSQAPERRDGSSWGGSQGGGQAARQARYRRRWRTWRWGRWKQGVAAGKGAGSGGRKGRLCMLPRASAAAGLPFFPLVPARSVRMRPLPTE